MLSDDVRSELAAIAPVRRCDGLAEISGLFHTAGTLHLLGHGEVALHLDLASSAVARRAFALLRELGVGSEIRTYRRHAFDRATRYQLHVDGSAAALGVLREAGIVGPGGAPLSRPPRRVVGRRCCRAAYVRGAFLGSGSVSGPRRPHLELRFADVEGAAFLADAAAQEDVVLRVRDRGRYGIVVRARSRADRGRAGARRRERRSARDRRARGDRSGACEREPARERRSRQPRADGEGRARAASGCAHARAAGRARLAPSSAPGDGSASRAIPVRVDPRARREVRSTNAEGDGAAAASAARGAGRR